MTRTTSFANSNIARFAQGDAVLHVRVSGLGFDIPLASLDVSPASSDQQIRNAAADHLGIPVERLGGYLIDRHANGNLTIRPEAVFG